MPAQKFRPSPERMATRASGVLSTQSKALRISCHIASFIEFDLSGRLRRISAMPSLREMVRVENVG